MAKENPKGNGKTGNGKGAKAQTEQQYLANLEAEQELAQKEFRDAKARLRKIQDERLQKTDPDAYAEKMKKRASRAERKAKRTVETTIGELVGAANFHNLKDLLDAVTKSLQAKVTPEMIEAWDTAREEKSKARKEKRQKSRAAKAAAKAAAEGADATEKSQPKEKAGAKK